MQAYSSTGTWQKKTALNTIKLLLLRTSTGRTNVQREPLIISYIDTRKEVETLKSHERFKRRRRSVYNCNM